MANLKTLALLGAILIGTTATANDSDFAYSAIAAKEWSKAESQLRSELTANPGDPLRLVNLAYVLQQQGRAGEAADVYQQVLAAKSNPKVAIGPDGKVKSMRVKAVASRAMEAMPKTNR